ncbi:MAG: hypothetical protein U0K35_04325, partial [Prevotella sp.]|nr:hypothetical protein [Prevotella sp.]
MPVLYILPVLNGTGRGFVALSSYTTNRYLIPNWGIDFLKSNLPNVVSTLVEQQVSQQVAYEKQKLALEYEQK